MKAEHWVIGAGAIFSLLVLVAALLPDGIWNGGPSNSPATRLAGGETARSGAAAGAADGQGWGRSGRVAGLVPFTQATSVRFRGRVTRMISRGSDIGWGQIHIWVDSGSGPATEISVAPNWYLQHLGCSVSQKSKVRGAAFKFSKVQSGAKLYAKNIAIGANSCRLRNDEGFALWSNRLR